MLRHLPTIVLLACASCASGARLLPAQRPLGPALAFASSRARAAAPRMQGFFDGIKDIALQYADQRVARASHIQLRAGDDSGILLAQWKEEIGDDEEKFAARARESSTCRSAPKGGDLGFLTVRARAAHAAQFATAPAAATAAAPAAAAAACSPPAAAQFSPPRDRRAALETPLAHRSLSLRLSQRGKLTKEFDDVIFQQGEEHVGRVSGPIATGFGMHLIYVHSCRSPSGSASAPTMPWDRK
jgi:hypothetical protein